MGFFEEHRGTGFAGPLVLPPVRGVEKRHEVREAWGRANQALRSRVKASNSQFRMPSSSV
ncbi:hypothetical protein J2X90_003676 [Variovorax paradoxus]|nr:hypothetical protein [Variovorax paradoxus]MDQ0025853.1 hypothetical protein [Variovorax paradoxus]